MIEVTKLDGQRVVINCDLIEEIAARPDTILRLTSGRYVMVQESVAELVGQLKRYRREIGHGSLSRGNALKPQLTEAV